MLEEPIDADLRHTFLGVLIEDVLAANSRIRTNNSPVHRRELIRASFAAIEGSTWLYREHVRIIAKEMGVLTPLADLALRERTFNVTDRGTIIEQVRYVTLPTIIRLTTRQAHQIAPSLTLDFAGQGGPDLKRAIEVRHRVTHPKTLEDLQVADSDIAVIKSAFDWVLAATDLAVSAIVDAFKSYAAELRNVVDGLTRGDSDMLAAYREAQMLDEDE